MGELPYYSTAMETWRAFNELGRLYVDSPIYRRNKEGENLLSNAKVLKKDIGISLERSTRDCIPYAAGAGLNKSLSLNNCTRVEGLVPLYHPRWHSTGPPTSPKQFKRVSEPWRSYAEMFHAHFLTPDQVRSIYR